MTRYCIAGCGDVGRRVLKQLLQAGVEPTAIHALVNSESSARASKHFAVNVSRFDLDQDVVDTQVLDGANCFYFVAPQKEGDVDKRSESLLRSLDNHNSKPSRVVLISTTGVYGDTGGEWVFESSETKPQTARAKRRLSMELQWLLWAQKHNVVLRILRVPGIYANDRIPRIRLEKAIPVVRARECGFSNRIHADDLATICIAADRYAGAEIVFNATDGRPGKITEYLQEASAVLGLPPLPEISMLDAQSQLSQGMLSYLSESRKISNEKMLSELKVALRYPDFRVGLRH